MCLDAARHSPLSAQSLRTSTTHPKRARSTFQSRSTSQTMALLATQTAVPVRVLQAVRSARAWTACWP